MIFRCGHHELKYFAAQCLDGIRKLVSGIVSSGTDGSAEVDSLAHIGDEDGGAELSLRFFIVRDLRQAAIRAMRLCRDAMIEVCRCAKPSGPAYHAASMVISAIDAMATFLTGERYYFSATGSAAGGAPAEQEARAHESGEKPWQP